MTREQLFQNWMYLKDDIQNIAGIVQNDVELTEDDWSHWLTTVDEFKRRFEVAKLATLRIKK